MKNSLHPEPYKQIKLRELIYAVAIFALFSMEAQAETLASTLYGVTGDGGTPAETLFELDKADASSTFVLTLGNGADGEEIAFNPDNGLLYHASGSLGGRIMETVNPVTLAVTPVVLSGSGTTEITGLTYKGSSVLLAADRVISSGLNSITTAGVVANIGATSTSLSGLAYIGATLYSVSKGDAGLRTINDTTGATLTTVTITLSGFTVSGATGLATNPEDDTLWALLKVSDGVSNPSFRALATLNTGTGVATLVGITDVKGLAGIAFVSGTAVTVTSSVGTPSGNISPLGAQVVITGRTVSFTLTPDAGYQVESVGGTCGGALDGDIYTTSAVTTDCTVIANFEVEPTTKLYGITGDGGLPAETLFQLDMTDASSTSVLTLGNGTDGEEIAFNRDDGLLYHASGSTVGGSANKILETINLVTLAVTPIPLSGDSAKEVVGMTYAGSGVLLAGDRTTAVGLSSITTGGLVTNIGATDATLMGLAYIGTTLYAVDKSDDLLRIIDPATGATLDSVTITLSGFTISGATGLATNPDDNSLWALLKVDILQPGERALAVIDPDTGIASNIGITDVPGMAGIAFKFIPCATCEVTPSVGVGPGTISPSTVQEVASGATPAFTLAADPNYHIDFVGGTCGGSLAIDIFTTAPITTHCTVVANFAIDTFDLIYRAGTGGSITGNTSQTVNYNGNGTQVTADPDPNYSFVNWSDAVTTPSRTDTNVMADIDVTANFVIDTYTVTSSVGTGLGNGNISPLGGQSVDHGATTQFTLSPDTGYHTASVDGTCGGSLVNNTFTTASITAACTVVANFAIDTFDLTYGAGTGGSISGNSSQTVDYNTDGTEVTAVPDANYSFVDWSDAVATPSRTDTNVMADIDVTANFVIDTHTVTSSVGTGPGSISPLGGQSIDHGTTTQFTLTPDPGYHSDSVGGTCGGTLVDNTFTTAAITAPCTVVANFALSSELIFKNSFE